MKSGEKKSETQQSRGPELKAKIESSEKYGEKYRAEHQGADSKDLRVQHKSIKSSKTKK